MKRIMLFFIVSLLLFIPSSSAQTSDVTVAQANFSEDLIVDETYEWNIDNYQIGDRRVETKVDPSRFEFVYGTDVELTILKDPSNFSLTDLQNLSKVDNFDQYFELKYDDQSFDFYNSGPLFIYLFPAMGKTTAGSDINLISNYWIYHIYSFLVKGEILDFNSTFPDASVKTEVDEDDDRYDLLFEHNTEDVSIDAEVQKSTGLLLDLSLISKDPDFRIEISKKGGGGGFLPLSPWIVVVPLALIPIIRKITNKR